MAKKYEGGWGIRVRKNVSKNSIKDEANIWLDESGKNLVDVNNAYRYKSREDAYEDITYNLPGSIGPLGLTWYQFAIDKLPIKVSTKPTNRWGIKNEKGEWLTKENDDVFSSNVANALVFTSLQEAKDNILAPNEIAAPLPKLTNPNPDRPWDIIFDRGPVPNQLQPGYIYKEIDPKSKDGKAILDLIKKMFGIEID